MLWDMRANFMPYSAWGNPRLYRNKKNNTERERKKREKENVNEMTTNKSTRAPSAAYHFSPHSNISSMEFEASVSRKLFVAVSFSCFNPNYACVGKWISSFSLLKSRIILPINRWFSTSSHLFRVKFRFTESIFHSKKKQEIIESK